MKDYKEFAKRIITQMVFLDFDDEIRDFLANIVGNQDKEELKKILKEVMIISKDMGIYALNVFRIEIKVDILRPKSVELFDKMSEAGISNASHMSTVMFIHAVMKESMFNKEIKEDEFLEKAMENIRPIEEIELIRDSEYRKMKNNK